MFEMSVLVTDRILFKPFRNAESVLGLPLYAALELISLWIDASGEMVGWTLGSERQGRAGVSKSPRPSDPSVSLAFIGRNLTPEVFTDRAELGWDLLRGGLPGVCLGCDASE